MGSIAALKKLRCAGIKTNTELIPLDRVEATVTTLIQDVKGTTIDKKINSYKKLPSFIFVLSVDQKKQVVSTILEALKKETVDLKALAAECLELLVDATNAFQLAKESNLIPDLKSMISTSHKSARRFGFRVLQKLASFPATREILVMHEIIPAIVTEIQKEPSAICSDAPLHLLATLATNPLYASRIANARALPLLITLLKGPGSTTTTSTSQTPCKLILPAIKTILKLARHDAIALRTVLNAGAAQAIARYMNAHALFTRRNEYAAKVLCELAATKDPEAQAVLLRAGIHDILGYCLRHTAKEVRKSANNAIEKWMYSDERLTSYSTEFYLTLVQNGVDILPQAKDLLTGLNSVGAVKPSPEASTIATLLAEIKKRPDTTNAELARLRTENYLLQMNLVSAKGYASNLEAIIAQSHSQVTPAPKPFDVSSIQSFEELSEIESKLTQRRQAIVTQLQETLQCGICYERKKDSSFVPCGHSLCTTCAYQLLANGGKCHVCRNKVERVGKLFL